MRLMMRFDPGRHHHRSVKAGGNFEGCLQHGLGLRDNIQSQQYSHERPLSKQSSSRCQRINAVVSCPETIKSLAQIDN